MTTANADLNSILPLSPATFHILLSLADQQRHGYSIMQDIAERTNGEIAMGPGTLYGAIKRLRKQGLIEEINAPLNSTSDDERRRYYRLTSFGQKVGQAEAERLAQLVRQAQAKQLLPQL